MGHTTFVSQMIGHTQWGIACTRPSLTRPCNCPVSRGNKSLRRCLSFLQIGRPNNRCTMYFLPRQNDLSHKYRISSNWRLCFFHFLRIVYMMPFLFRSDTFLECKENKMSSCFQAVHIQLDIFCRHSLQSQTCQCRIQRNRFQCSAFQPYTYRKTVGQQRQIFQQCI